MNSLVEQDIQLVYKPVYKHLYKCGNMMNNE